METLTQETFAVPALDMRSRPVLLWIFALGAVAVRLFFWFYTDRTWEDSLITLQHAENAARGLGLTHDLSAPPLHGFTSPLSALIPLIGELLHRGSGLFFQKALSALCGGVSVWLGMRIALRLALPLPLVLLVGGYLAIEHHQILWGMAGMETQVAVAILLYSCDTLFDLSPSRLGIGLGLCMLARPDFVLWDAIVIGLLGWRAYRTKNFRSLGIVIFVFLLVYGPWIAFTIAYYGSVVPNTIVAKSYAFTSHWWGDLSFLQVIQLSFRRVRHLIFGGLGPAFGGNGSGFVLFSDRGAIALMVLLFLVPGAWTALARKSIPILAIFAFVIVYTSYCFFLMSFVFGWYTVPLAAITIIASAVGLNTCLMRIHSARIRERVSYMLTAAYLFSLAAIMPVTFEGEKHLQQYVEDGNRKQIGLYLAKIMGTNQTVGSESLGYVGYYSRRHVYDYPGLCNRDVVEYMRSHPKGRNLIDMLNFFRPDYLVLRPSEYAAASTSNQWLKSDYVLLRDFRVPQAEREALLAPDLNIDLEFYVLGKRNASR